VSQLLLSSFAPFAFDQHFRFLSVVFKTLPCLAMPGRAVPRRAQPSLAMPSRVTPAAPGPVLFFQSLINNQQSTIINHQSSWG